MCSVMYLPGQVGDSVCVGQRSGDGGEERVLLFLQVSYLGVTYQSGWRPLVEPTIAPIIDDPS